MIPIVKQTYTATTAGTQRVMYRCEACGVETGAIASAVSQGYSEAIYFVGMKQAEGESTQRAAAGLPAALRRSIGLAGCPKCGARDRRERRLAILGSIGRGALAVPWLSVPLLLLAIAGVAYASDELTPTAIGYGAAAIVPFVLVLAIATRFAYRRATRDASSLVVWDGEASLLDPPSP